MRAVNPAAWPGTVCMSTPASTLGGPPTGGGGPSPVLHVTAHTASVPTTASIATRSYRMSSFPGPTRLGLREPRGGAKPAPATEAGRDGREGATDDPHVCPQRRLAA